MIVLIIAILLGLGLTVTKPIRKYELYLYILACLVSIASIIWNELPLFALLVDGYFGLAFLYIVMLTGSFEHRTTISKKLRTIRKVYSILGFIFLVPHAAIFLYYSLSGSVAFEWYGIIAFVIMIPLFVVSFQTIRKHVGNDNWFLMHRASYVVYLFIFIHLMMTGTTNIIYYIVLFSVYSLLKFYNDFYQKYRLPKTILTTAVIIVGVYFASGATIVLGDSQYESAIPEDAVFIDGTYHATATGYEDHVVDIDVVIQNNEIIDIIVYDCGCTPEDKRGLYLIEANALLDRIISANGLDVYTVAGATHTNDGILEAVEEALLQAIEPNEQ